jgi:kynurenine formamidase
VSKQADALAAIAGLNVYDVSFTISPEMPMWFLYEPPEIVPTLNYATHGAAANRISMSEHTGTHVDAPSHFVTDGSAIAEVPVDTLFLRPYKKYDLGAVPLAPGQIVELEDLKAAEASAGFTLEPGDVAVLNMGWERHLPDGSDPREPGWWGRNQPGLSADACRYLADAGIVAVASDTVACDVAAKDGEILSGHGHAESFLPRGILIVEALRHLDAVPATGLFCALPLKIAAGTASPIRVILLGE